ncbi:MAG: hypothetical protein IT420_12295 [Candidatus Brocadia sp.]|nr:hypothetical protein [Candidatus Brocadia sp.]MDG5996632.1 hypothetical protein [Candidatus Brocadia sp.]
MERVSAFLIPDYIAQHSHNHVPVVKAEDCFGQDPRNDAGYVFDEILSVVITNEAKQSFSYK